MKVFVYRNLRRGCLSIRDTKTKRVIAHLNEIYLRDVKFKVSKAGRERVLKEKQKNVHAGVEGFIIDPHEIGQLNKGRVVYNPYKYESFVNAETLEPQYASDHCRVTIEGAYV